MPRPAPASYVNRWTSMVGALSGVLRALGSPLSPAEISVLSGHAFRFVITETPDGVIGADGPSCFSAASALPLYEGLGRRFHAIEVEPADPDFDTARRRALEEIERASRRGRPVIAYGLHLPEFGIVRAVEGSSLLVSTTMSAQYGERLPAEQWPSPGRELPLRLFLPEKEIKPARAQALHRALTFAVTHARDGESAAPPGCTPLADGLAAFERWLAILEGDEPISPSGMSYCVQALQEARADAATLLAAEAQPALQEASSAYRAVVLELSRMATLFPYPNGGDVRSPGSRRTGAASVRRALDAEMRAVAALSRAL